MRALAAILWLLATVQYSSAAERGDAFGLWLLPESGAQYRLTACQGDRLCATVEKEGHKGDEALRPKPKGTTVITGARWDGEAWKTDNMRLFGVVVGGIKVDDVEATLAATGNKLSVEGCKFLVCRTFVWTRIE